jgi:hypothetical protein
MHLNAGTLFKSLEHIVSLDGYNIHSKLLESIKYLKAKFRETDYKKAKSVLPEELLCQLRACLCHGFCIPAAI